MTQILIIFSVTVLAAAYLGWFIVIVVRGKKYQTLVKDEVLAELGVTAEPYLARPSMENEITNAFRRRDTAVSTARAIIGLIRQEQKLEGNSS